MELGSGLIGKEDKCHAKDAIRKMDIAQDASEVAGTRERVDHAKDAVTMEK